MSSAAAGDAAARHSSAMAVLADLLEASPEQRRERLDAIGTDDPALAAHVGMLLSAHDGAGDFLAVTPFTAESDPIPGAPIGPFEIIRALGHGGMGTVWLGVRTTEEFTQQVALKVLRADLGGSADARFRDERRILAALTHPYIAHLVDGGTTADGRLYLAMEYVDGVPITTHADRTGLDAFGRLRLLLKVCAAVQYAHQNLVVHRDIKPSNLLVTADGTPKLLDFGIARLTEGASHERTSTAAALTPYYASPEQVGGRPLTTATDIYSLGVLAYELLTGAGPYRSITPDSGALAVLEAIRDEDPERPSTSRRGGGRALDAEVDAILLKALAKDPADRYVSADQLAQDIARYLDGMPVLARGAGAGYRLRKFVTRHWAGVAAAIVAVTALGVAAAVSSYQAKIARDERALAERRFDDVRKLANAFVFEFDEAVRDTPGTTAARKLVIQRSLTYLEDLARDTRDNVTLERELAAAYSRIGDVQGNPYLPNLGERDAAMASYRRALSLRERVAAGPDAIDADRVALVEAIAAVADLEWAQGRFENALAEQARATTLAMTLLGQATGDPAKRRHAASTAKYREGQSLTKLGRFADARARYEESVRLLELSDRSTPEERRFGAVCRMKVGDCRIRDGDVTGAQQDYQAASAALSELAGEDPKSGNLLRSRAFVIHRQAMAAAVAGDADGAERFGLQALDMQQRLASADPNDLQVQGDIAASLSTLGAIDTWQRRYASAETRLLSATRLYERIAEGGASYVDQMSERAQAWRRLGDLRAAAGNPRAALDTYATARTLLAQTETDREYAPERVLLNTRAAIAAATVTSPSGPTAGERAAWLTTGRETWARLQQQGLRTWFGEFGSPAKLSEAAAVAVRAGDPVRAR